MQNFDLVTYGNSIKRMRPIRQSHWRWVRTAMALKYIGYHLASFAVLCAAYTVAFFALYLLFGGTR